MRIKLIEKYLIEDIEAVRRQYSYVPTDEFDRIIRLDPTFNEERDSVGKYGKWLLGLYKKDKENLNDSTTDIISEYDRLKNDRRYNIEKDIMRFRNVQDMKNAINNVGDAELSKKQKNRQAKKDKNYDMVFEGDKYAIFVPKNHDGDMVLASFGGSSKALWCTAADSKNGIYYYDHYLEDGGKYYVIINKNDYEEKYQFHFESDQFNDEGNQQIDTTDFFDSNPDIKKFFNDRGYDTDYIGISEEIDEIYYEISNTGDLNELWQLTRENNWEIFENLREAIINKNPDLVDDIFYENLRKVLPEFSTNIQPEPQADFEKKVMFEILKANFNSGGQSSLPGIFKEYTNSLRCGGTYRFYYDLIGEENRLRRFIYQYGDPVDYDIDYIYEDVINEVCDTFFHGQSNDYVNEANLGELYYLLKLQPHDNLINVEEIAEKYIASEFGGENLKNTIISGINATINLWGNPNGPFKDIDGVEYKNKNVWTIYTLDATIGEFEEWTGKNFREIPRQESFNLLIEIIPFEKIKKEEKITQVAPESDLYGMDIAIKNDKSEFIVGRYFKNVPQEIICKKFNIPLNGKTESYRRIKLKEY